MPKNAIVRAARKTLTADEVAKRKAALSPAKPAEQKKPEQPAKPAEQPATTVPALAPVKTKRISKYDPSFIVTKVGDYNTPKRNGRNPYTYYTAEPQTIGDILAKSKGQWGGKDGVVMADFWWDSAFRAERVGHPAAVIKITAPEKK